MGNRYVVSGADIGILIGLFDAYQNKQDDDIMMCILDNLEAILDRQHIGYSTQPIQDDIKILMEFFNEKTRRS